VLVLVLVLVLEFFLEGGPIEHDYDLIAAKQLRRE
jgi:hypothetical protein